MIIRQYDYQDKDVFGTLKYDVENKSYKRHNVSSQRNGDMRKLYHIIQNQMKNGIKVLVCIFDWCKAPTGLLSLYAKTRPKDKTFSKSLQSGILKYQRVTVQYNSIPYHQTNEFGRNLDNI